jgi:transcription elongation GreA/GreB family factor
MSIYVTESGRQRLYAELSRKRKEYEEICEERTTAYALSGDGWHDNPYFNRLQQMDASKTVEIAALQKLIASALPVTIVEGQRPIDRVGIGSVVHLRLLYEESGEESEHTWEITGYNENDLARHRLAYNTPLAAAVMGLVPGECHECRLPRGPVSIEIMALLPDRPQGLP